MYGDAETLLWQTLAVIATPAYAFVMTYGLLRLLGALMPLRATDSEQAIGMDVIQHGEEAYATGEGALLIDPDGPRDRGLLVADPI